MRPALSPEHGTLLFSRGLVAQVIGVPSPPGMIAAVPKYALCAESPLGGSVPFCRLIWSYGPRGIASVVSLAKPRPDGLYGAPMPYFSLEDVELLLRPQEALQRALSSPPRWLGEELYEALERFRSWGISLGELGLTGSLALRIENPALSDVDLVVYGSRAARRAYEAFSSLGAGSSEEPGGVVLRPPLDSGWRRNRLGGVYVSWVGVPTEGELCPPLRSYFHIATPARPVRTSFRVAGGQEGALLYPPCVRTEEGRHVVSFEFLLGRALHEGGRFEALALESWDRETLYLGARELPGELRRVSP
ncbi:MAG: hypothetical protein ABDH61_01790 [Acidilobaceae archaeon]